MSCSSHHSSSTSRFHIRDSARCAAAHRPSQRDLVAADVGGGARPDDGATRRSGVDLSRLAAVSGSAQQHGSVYLNATWPRVLEGLTPDRPIADQIRGIFSREESPIWMDSSTSEECAEIAAAVGGAGVLAQRTGSRAFERFTGPQIRRFSKQSPDAYHATTRVHLVSSFLASMLAGADAPVDPGDASGMNLMDLTATSGGPRRLTRPRSGSRRSCRRSLPLAQSLVRCRPTGGHVTDCRPHA